MIEQQPIPPSILERLDRIERLLAVGWSNQRPQDYESAWVHDGFQAYMEIRRILGIPDDFNPKGNRG